MKEDQWLAVHSDCFPIWGEQVIINVPGSEIHSRVLQNVDTCIPLGPMIDVSLIQRAAIALFVAPRHTVCSSSAST
jgi:hypothetical protein